MDRRRFLLTSLAGALAAPLAAEAQQAGKLARIGWITIAPQSPQGPEEWRSDFARHLRQSGWDPRFELRYAADDLARLATMADELAKAGLDVIVSPDTQGAAATKKATATVPIAMVSADAVAAGLVSSLARPGGNVTGVSVAYDDGIGGKWVELLHELGAARGIAVVWNPVDRMAAGRMQSMPDVFRRLAVYVDRILRGAKPGELPVEQVQKYDLTINLKTAKAFGLTIPPSLLLRADGVIE